MRNWNDTFGVLNCRYKKTEKRKQAMRPNTFYRLLLISIIVPAVLSLSPFEAVADAPDGTWQFQALQEKLIKDGFQPDKIRTYYQNPQVTFERRSVSLFFVHSEAKLNYDQFTNDWSISQARKYMKKHQAQLEKTEEIYGVDKRVITAIILVETGLGTTLGKSSTLNTLSSLSSFEDPAVRKEFSSAPTTRCATGTTPTIPWTVPAAAHAKPITTWSVTINTLRIRRASSSKTTVPWA